MTKEEKAIRQRIAKKKKIANRRLDSYQKGKKSGKILEIPIYEDFLGHRFKEGTKTVRTPYFKYSFKKASWNIVTPITLNHDSLVEVEKLLDEMLKSDTPTGKKSKHQFVKKRPETFKSDKQEKGYDLFTSFDEASEEIDDIDDPDLKEYLENKLSQLYDLMKVSISSGNYTDEEELQQMYEQFITDLKNNAIKSKADLEKYKKETDAKMDELFESFMAEDF